MNDTQRRILFVAAFFFILAAAADEAPGPGWPKGLIGVTLLFFACSSKSDQKNIPGR